MNKLNLINRPLFTNEQKAKIIQYIINSPRGHTIVQKALVEKLISIGKDGRGNTRSQKQIERHINNICSMLHILDKLIGGTCNDGDIKTLAGMISQDRIKNKNLADHFGLDSQLIRHARCNYLMKKLPDLLKNSIYPQIDTRFGPILLHQNRHARKKPKPKNDPVTNALVVKLNEALKSKTSEISDHFTDDQTFLELSENYIVPTTPQLIDSIQNKLVNLVNTLCAHCVESSRFRDTGIMHPITLNDLRNLYLNSSERLGSLHTTTLSVDQPETEGLLSEAVMSRKTHFLTLPDNIQNFIKDVALNVSRIPLEYDDGYTNGVRQLNYGDFLHITKYAGCDPYQSIHDGNGVGTTITGVDRQAEVLYIIPYGTNSALLGPYRTKHDGSTGRTVTASSLTGVRLDSQKRLLIVGRKKDSITYYSFFTCKHPTNFEKERYDIQGDNKYLLGYICEIPAASEVQIEAAKLAEMTPVEILAENFPTLTASQP